MRACHGREVDATPVWFMRQAGRYMEEYRRIREHHTLLEICQIPELAAEVTMQPIRRFEIDAAIIFADILLPLLAMGVDFRFAAGEGPILQQPVRTSNDIQQLRTGDVPESLHFVFEAIRLVRRQLPEGTALIGFAGAPFTLASYMIEGGHSRHFIETKLMMYREPETWRALMEKISEVTIQYLQEQKTAGAQVLQLFDSWVGALGPDDYARYVLPYSRRIVQALADDSVPLIYFGTGTATLLELMKQTGAQVIGIDWRIELDKARDVLGGQQPVQGNLDPVALLGPLDVLERKVEQILAQAAGRPGHIFNLGHGILPQTPVENVEAVVNWVHEKTSGQRR